jgi:hypothetical protein
MIAYTSTAMYVTQDLLIWHTVAQGQDRWRLRRWTFQASNGLQLQQRGRSRPLGTEVNAGVRSAAQYTSLMRSYKLRGHMVLIRNVHLALHRRSMKLITIKLVHHMCRDDALVDDRTLIRREQSLPSPAAFDAQ